MTRKTSDRRAFLKKAAMTTTVAGGAFASVEPAAASDQTLVVESRSGPGSYDIYVNDGSASGVSSTLESGDEVDNSSGESRLSGDLTDGDVDKYEFTGQVTAMDLRGYIDVTVKNPNGTNLGGRMDVEGGNDNTYYVKSTNDMYESYSNLESDDGVTSSGDACEGTLGFSDTDSYDVNGTLEYVSVTATDDYSVTINHYI